MAQHDLSEGDYRHVGDRDGYTGYSDAERDALEYCEKFAADHLSIDQALMDRLVGHYGDELVMDMTLSIGCWLAFGRLTQVMGAEVSCPIVLEADTAPREPVEH